MRYREIAPAKCSHLRSSRTELFKQIARKDLSDKAGDFYKITADNAIYMPMMEMSCGRVYKIEDEYSYLYNIETGFNDYLNLEKQAAVDKEIRSLKKYECYKPFDEKMKQLA